MTLDALFDRMRLASFGAADPNAIQQQVAIGDGNIQPFGWMSGTMTDAVGNPTFSTDLNAATAAGGAFRRFLQSGVFNGDFVLPPYAPSGSFSATNPLPYWTFTQASGTAITAASQVDSSAASGRSVLFSMAAGAAGDDSYLEQIVPVNGSRGQSFVYVSGAAWKTGTSVSAAKVYINVVYLNATGATVGGSTTSSATTTSIGASTVYDHTAGSSSIPATAYYLRIRVGFKRDTAATSTTETVTLCEVRTIVGGTKGLVVDELHPGPWGAATFTQTDGLLALKANFGGTTPGYSPLISLRGDVGGIELYTQNGSGVGLKASDGGEPPYLTFQERTDPGVPSTNYARLYAKDNGAGKTQIVVQFATGVVQVIATEP